MTATTRVAAAVAAGYLLGRTKKLKLAITVGSMLAGGRLAGNVKPGALVQSLSQNPEVQRLQDQLRGQVLAAAKSAATNVASSRLESLNASLQGGAGSLQSGAGGASKKLLDRSDDQDEPDTDQVEEQPEDQSEGQPDDQSDDQGDETPRRESRRPRKRSESSGTSTASSSRSRTSKSAASRSSGSSGGEGSSSTTKRPVRKRAASSSAGR